MKSNIRCYAVSRQLLGIFGNVVRLNNWRLRSVTNDLTQAFNTDMLLQCLMVRLDGGVRAMSCSKSWSRWVFTESMWSCQVPKYPIGPNPNCATSISTFQDPPRKSHLQSCNDEHTLYFTAQQWQILRNPQAALGRVQSLEPLTTSNKAPIVRLLPCDGSR